MSGQRVNVPQMPPPDLKTEICTRCGGHYLPSQAGRDAHSVVFGHTPETKD